MIAALLGIAQLAIGGVPFAPGDFLDGRAIAGPTGAPIIMLTLTPAAMKRIAGKTAVSIDGATVTARIAEGVIEVEGQPDFDAARALARALSGKDPVPETP